MQTQTATLAIAPPELDESILLAAEILSDIRYQEEGEDVPVEVLQERILQWACRELVTLIDGLPCRYGEVSIKQALYAQQ